MAALTEEKKVFKWQVVFTKNANIKSQEIIKCHDFPEQLIHSNIDSPDKRIADLFFAEDEWVLHVTTQHKKVMNQAIRSRDEWEPFSKEVEELGNEKWRIHSITWGMFKITRIYREFFFFFFFFSKPKLKNARMCLMCDTDSTETETETETEIETEYLYRNG
jgi:hypothetical protein